MQYRKQDYESSREIFIEDKFLSQDCDIFQNLINEFTDSTKTNLIINFEETQFMDTRGLGSLLLALQKVNDANKSLLLKNPRDAVKSSLEMLKFDTLFNIQFTH